MTAADTITNLRSRLAAYPRFALAQVPTPLHQLVNFGRHLGLDLWMKRDDLSGLEGGGNKTRKLEFLVGDALREGADTLVTVGALQSNHTRQVAAAAAKAGLKSALLHCSWTDDAGPHYRAVGNLLFSSIMGAELFYDSERRHIDDQGPLLQLAQHLRSGGRKPYVIPGGASEHRLGSLGYMVCALEIEAAAEVFGRPFDYIVHTTGSSSTQAGLLAGLKALGSETRVIGVSDDDETENKYERVPRLANETLAMLGLPQRITADDMEVVISDINAYGRLEKPTLDAIHLLARLEGIVADPVYEAKAVRGLINLAASGRFEPRARVLLIHLGGTPATHAYANQFGHMELKPVPTQTSNE